MGKESGILFCASNKCQTTHWLGWLLFMLLSRKKLAWNWSGEWSEVLSCHDARDFNCSVKLLEVRNKQSGRFFISTLPKTCHDATLLSLRLATTSRVVICNERYLAFLRSSRELATFQSPKHTNRSSGCHEQRLNTIGGHFSIAYSGTTLAVISHYVIGAQCTG